MDVRLTSEQQQLRDAAAKLADDLGPGTVADLDDDGRAARLEKTVASTGWRSLRSDEASGVEVAIVAEEFGRGLVDVPFLGPVLADDLQRRLGRELASPDTAPESVDLTGLAATFALTLSAQKPADLPRFSSELVLTTLEVQS